MDRRSDCSRAVTLSLRQQVFLSTASTQSYASRSLGSFKAQLPHLHRASCPNAMQAVSLSLLPLQRIYGIVARAWLPSDALLSTEHPTSSLARRTTHAATIHPQPFLMRTHPRLMETLPTTSTMTQTRCTQYLEAGRQPGMQARRYERTNKHPNARAHAHNVCATIAGSHILPCQTRMRARLNRVS